MHMRRLLSPEFREGEYIMPFYDLHCAACGGDFNIRASVADKTEKKIVCPECGANRLETIFKPVNILVKSGGEAPPCPNSHICGAGCRHAG